jgi:guanylate kinase
MPTGRGRLIVVAGPSGVGKGAIVSRLLAARPDLKLSVSATTRPKRRGEVEERHYYFVDPEAFDRLIETGGLLEWAEIFGHRYGTPREPVERALGEGRDVVVEIDVQGARQIRAICPDAFMVFIKPPSLEELERRLRRRATETDEQVRRRLAKAAEELAAEPEFDATVVNDVLGHAAGEVIEILDKLRQGNIKYKH